MNTLSKKNSKKDYLSLYNVNPETNAYILELSLEDYSELFNGWDASSLKRKEIEPELMDYFEQAATEIPLKEKIEICFYVPSHLRSPDKEAKSISAIANNFRIKLLFTNKSLHDTFRRFVFHSIVSILLITSAYALPKIVGELSLLFKIVVEGMFILGWWILWEGSSFFFFNGHDIRRSKKFFERYLASKIYFKDGDYPEKV